MIAVKMSIMYAKGTNRSPPDSMQHRLVTALFLLAAVGLVAAVPWLPEPRDEKWLARHEQFLNLTRQHASQIKVVFLGDSITAGWAGNGHAVWNQHYQPRHAYNYGIGGDHTEHVLWRIEHEFENVHPELVVLMIGEFFQWITDSK